MYVRNVPVKGDGDQSEYADIDAEDLNRRAKLTHKLGQIPSLQQRGVKLERNCEEGDGHVGEGQVGDVVIRHRPHPGRGKHHVNDQRIAQKRGQRN